MKVELYPHQENSYIEKYCAVKTNITFWGTKKYERIEEEETTYKIYRQMSCMKKKVNRGI